MRVDQASVSVGVRDRVFDLSGGALCLDFANTLDDRPAPRPNEFLETYADLLAFARATASLPEGQRASLLAEARRRPADAAEALGRTLALRETIYRLLRALAEERPAPSTDLESLNAALADALSHAHIVAGEDGGFTWGWVDAPVDLLTPAWPIVRSAADLLASPNLSALRLCASESCAWLFLDTSRNGSRRWCSMRTCGNRAKARRHHARIRAIATASR